MDNTANITTTTFFKLEGFSNKWWAFKQMRLGIQILERVDGLIFSRILGSGAKNGFSSIPNFGTYVLLCVWESEENALSFFKHHFFYKNYKKRSVETFTAFTKSVKSHGKWDGQNPFGENAEVEAESPIMVITRARIRLSGLFSFWRNVGKVSHSLKGHKGILVSIGVGEWPLIRQATISIWQKQSEMIQYAYHNPEHKKVIELTRKLDWYEEEMFSRFAPYRLEGIWDGRDMENALVPRQTFGSPKM